MVKRYERVMPYVNSFGDVPVGEPLLYLNSLMQVSFAYNQSSMAALSKISSGPQWQVTVIPASAHEIASPGTVVPRRQTPPAFQHHRAGRKRVGRERRARGLVLVNAMHITASVFINDDEGGLHRDWERWLEKLAPEKPHSQYEHNGGEDNADAHLKRTIMGREVVVAITAGKLDLGPWEQIFYYELDGLRDKRVLVKIIGE